MSIKSIGIMRLSALGDIVWTIPMINRLKDGYPDSKITYFVDKSFAPVLEGVEGLSVQIINKPRNPIDYFKLWKLFKNYQFDLFLCTQANFRVNLIYPLISAKRKIGFDRKRGRDFHHLFIKENIPFRKEHSLDAFLGFCDFLEIPKGEVKFDIQSKQQDIDFLDSVRCDRPYIVIHPKASSDHRTWPIGRYIKLINLINQNLKVDIFVTGAPSDREFIDLICDSCEHGPLNLSGRTSINQLKVILKHAEVVVAPDSGPIHLAQAMGATTLGLYAAVPTDYTGPYGQQDNCIDVYDEAIVKYMGKDPQKTPWRTRIRKKGIMNLISTDMVFNKLKELMKND